VVAIYMEDSSQGQIETSLHFFNNCSLWMYRKFWRKWGDTIAFQKPRFCVGVSWEEFL